MKTGEIGNLKSMFLLKKKSERTAPSSVFGGGSWLAFHSKIVQFAVLGEKQGCRKNRKEPLQYSNTKNSESTLSIDLKNKQTKKKIYISLPHKVLVYFEVCNEIKNDVTSVTERISMLS